MEEAYAKRRKKEKENTIAASYSAIILGTSEGREKTVGRKTLGQGLNALKACKLGHLIKERPN